MRTNMYVEYEFLVRQQKTLLNRLKQLERCIKHIDGKHCVLNLNEDGQWFVELSYDKARNIVVDEMKETKEKLNEMTLKVIEELEKIVAKEKMIQDALESEQTEFEDLFGKEDK